MTLRRWGLQIKTSFWANSGVILILFCFTDVHCPLIKPTTVRVLLASSPASQPRSQKSCFEGERTEDEWSRGEAGKQTNHSGGVAG